MRANEGPPHLVVGASRALRSARLWWVFGYAVTAALGSAAVWWLAPVPFGLVISDALFLAAVTVLGLGTLGSRLGWLLTLATALVASGPPAWFRGKRTCSTGKGTLERCC